jgi:hypothetical protein
MYVKNSMSFEGVLNSMQTINSAYIDKMIQARETYVTANVFDPETLDLSMGKPDIEMVSTICETFISADDVKKVCSIINQVYNSTIFESTCSCKNMKDIDHKCIDSLKVSDDNFNNFTSCEIKQTKDVTRIEKQQAIQQAIHQPDQQTGHQENIIISRKYWPDPLYYKLIVPF